MELTRCLFTAYLFLLGVSLAAAGGNIAVGKSAVQSSVYSKSVQSSVYGIRTADRAVDGSYENNVHADHCSNTDTQGSWWTVDLGAVYKLTRIIIYQALQSSHQVWADGLTVEGFLADPQFFPNTTGSPCATNPGPSGAIVNLTCSADTEARFVRLTVPNKLHLCEVEMYGERWTVIQGCGSRLQDASFLPGMTSTTAAVELGYAGRRIDCLALCQRHPICNVAGYNTVTRMCSKHATPVLTVADADISLIYVP